MQRDAKACPMPVRDRAGFTFGRVVDDLDAHILARQIHQLQAGQRRESFAAVDAGYGWFRALGPSEQ